MLKNGLVDMDNVEPETMWNGVSIKPQTSSIVIKLEE
mgnify:CR=1 FL=1|jgi:hypothetical protein